MLVRHSSAILCWEKIFLSNVVNCWFSFSPPYLSSSLVTLSRLGLFLFLSFRSDASMSFFSTFPITFKAKLQANEISPEVDFQKRGRRMLVSGTFPEFIPFRVLSLELTSSRERGANLPKLEMDRTTAGAYVRPRIISGKFFQVEEDFGSHRRDVSRAAAVAAGCQATTPVAADISKDTRRHYPERRRKQFAPKPGPDCASDDRLKHVTRN